MLEFMLAGLETRPSINDLCREFHIQSDILAILADVPEQTIQNMLVLKPVHEEEAQRVLEELSILLRTECTFETVLVVLTGECHETKTARYQTHN